MNKRRKKDGHWVASGDSFHNSAGECVGIWEHTVIFLTRAFTGLSLTYICSCMGLVVQQYLIKRGQSHETLH